MTRYVITLRKVAGKVYAGPHRRWTTVLAHALTFEAQTLAILYAIDELALADQDFDIEAIAVPDPPADFNQSER